MMICSFAPKCDFEFPIIYISVVLYLKSNLRHPTFVPAYPRVPQHEIRRTLSRPRRPINERSRVPCHDVTRRVKWQVRREARALTKPRPCLSTLVNPT